MKDPKLYLIHIKESLDWIKKFTSEGEQAFFADRKTQDAVIRNLETLAEATMHLPDEIKNRYPNIDWSGIIGFRNILAHDYLGIILARVWNVIEEDLPALERAILKELN